jgi:hypothetical protein
LAISSQQQGGKRSTGCEYLIICPDGPEFLQWADTIRQFRTEQGIITMVVPISEVGGNSTTTIEEYINNAYATWDIPPAACLMLGDYGSNGQTSITSNLLNDHPNGNNPYVSDNPFSDVNEDLLPDVIFSRITARNGAELELMVSKFLNYERNPPMSIDFYNHPITALGWQTERWFQICSEAVGGYFRNVHGKSPVRINEVYGGSPETDPWSTAENSQAVLDVFGPTGLGYIPATPGELGNWSGGNATGINNAVNNGAFLLQHRDHGYHFGWGEPDYDTTDISGLNNTDLPFVMSINCQTGKFNMTGQCFAEKFHRHQAGGQGSGALGLIAPTEISYSFVNDVFVWGLYDNMFPDFLPQFGATPASRGMLPAFGNAAGKYFLYASDWPGNPSVKAITIKLFHHHGDAFSCLYSEVPQNLTVAHDSIQLAGIDSFHIQADEGTLIAFSVNGELIGTATGSGSWADIPIIPQTPPNIIDVVVTKENYIRYHTRVQVIPPTGPFVIADSYVVSDEQSNNNGRLDCGETVFLDMTLKNLGSESSGNVTATISSVDEYLTIIDNDLEAGVIPPGGVEQVTNAFSIRAAENVPNGHIIKIIMEASGGDTAWASSFNVKAYSPILKYGDFSISDLNGNNNGRLDPGETAEIEVSLKNTGGSDASGVYGILQCDDPYIRIMTDTAFYGNISLDGTITQSFTVSSLVITPPGHQADFTVNFTGNMGINASGNISLFIGLFPVLVLDLDGNENSGILIKDAIDDWRIFAEYKDEIPEDLSQYNTIFMCLGTSNENHTLDSTEAIPFVTFLSNGGNLYLEGADAWYYDPLYHPNSLYPMFNIDGIIDGNGDLGIITGTAGTFTEGMTFYYNGDNEFIDHITGIDPAYNIFNNNSPGYNIAVAYDAGTYKTIGSAFEFGGLTDNQGSTRKKLIQSYLDFFGMNPITEIPETPGGESIICSNTTSAVYSTRPVPGALYYIWELSPAAAGIVEGWDTMVTVNWTTGYTGNSTLRVCGMNQFGLGPVSSSLLMNRVASPTATATISDTEICSGDTTYINILLTGVTPWHMIISLGGNEVIMNPIKPNMAAIPLSPSADTEVQILSLTDGNGCISTDFPPALITVHPLPSLPEKPTGPENIDLFASTQSNYSTAGGISAVTYSWDLQPPESGELTISDSGMDCTVDWETSFTGQAELKVAGINDCGEGEFSDLLTINVVNTFGIGENETGPGIFVYPNPNDGTFLIELKTEHSTRARLKLFNAVGEPVWAYRELQVDERISIPFTSGSLPEGIYLLEVIIGEGIFTRKILIRK